MIHCKGPVLFAEAQGHWTRPPKPDFFFQYNIKDSLAQYKGEKMDRDFIEYVYKNCESALVKDEKYRILQSKHVEAVKKGEIDLIEEISCAMECRTEEICFMAGFKAAIQIMINIRD